VDNLSPPPKKEKTESAAFSRVLQVLKAKKKETHSKLNARLF